MYVCRVDKSHWSILILVSVHQKHTYHNLNVTEFAKQVLSAHSMNLKRDCG